MCDEGLDEVISFCSTIGFRSVFKRKFSLIYNQQIFTAPRISSGAKRFILLCVD